MTYSFMDILQLSGKGIISLIGAGGKTSLMFQLAKEIVQSERKVLTTTTTKIFMPQPYQSPDTVVENDYDKLLKKVRSNLNKFSHFSAGSKYDKGSNKLKGFTPAIIHKLWMEKLFDWIIVEADGARQKPIKASNQYEPVVPKKTTHLILVAGLDAVGKILDDKYVHRPKIFSDNTGLAMGKILTEQAIAKAIAIEIEKSRQLCQSKLNIVFLNKADILDQKASGLNITNLLKTDTIIDKIITASLKDNVVITN
jgi:probable selenium-dependent hydroxylase accessory protein YqeC